MGSCARPSLSFSRSPRTLWPYGLNTICRPCLLVELLPRKCSSCRPYLIQTLTRSRPSSILSLPSPPLIPSPSPSYHLLIPLTRDQADRPQGQQNEGEVLPRFPRCDLLSVQARRRRHRRAFVQVQGRRHWCLLGLQGARYERGSWELQGSFGGSPFVRAIPLPRLTFPLPPNRRMIASSHRRIACVSTGI